MSFQSDIQHFVSAFRDKLQAASDAVAKGDTSVFGRVHDEMSQSAFVRTFAARVESDSDYRGDLAKASAQTFDSGFDTATSTVRTGGMKRLAGWVSTVLGAVVMLGASEVLVALAGLLLMVIGIKMIGDSLRNAADRMMEYIEQKFREIAA